MICIKANIPEELSQIDDELKAIYHSSDTVCFFIFKTREQRNDFIERTKTFIRNCSGRCNRFGICGYHVQRNTLGIRDYFLFIQ